MSMTLFLERHQPNDKQSIFVSTWYPSLSKIPLILHRSYRLIENDIKLSKIFKTRSTAAFRAMKTISNRLLKTEIVPYIEESKATWPCWKYKFWFLLNGSSIMQNKIKNIDLAITKGSNWKSSWKASFTWWDKRNITTFTSQKHWNSFQNNFKT